MTIPAHQALRALAELAGIPGQPHVAVLEEALAEGEYDKTYSHRLAFLLEEATENCNCSGRNE